jgi:hypothetical protein
MALFLLLLLILGVVAMGIYALFAQVRKLPVHLGWLGLTLIFFAQLINAWPKG